MALLRNNSQWVINSALPIAVMKWEMIWLYPDLWIYPRGLALFRIRDKAEKLGGIAVRFDRTLMAQMIKICADLFLKLKKPICITKALKGHDTHSHGQRLCVNININILVLAAIIFLALINSR
ncbi:hypothetical protein DN752_14555 [Echinicola strongylocentroti]|uniref:Uncharacterized protein n=1 Tax=Echinicola strongylocentroti TaxID=1795355 RepID=A0A2Z4IL05_9BACT|nr:hypothetical protein [Echinicola strongylocentroti]AWW31246.1 hypothetical protein DN752_14555 [Echinicola strongylocentroti]